MQGWSRLLSLSEQKSSGISEEIVTKIPILTSKISEVLELYWSLHDQPHLTPLLSKRLHTKQNLRISLCDLIRLGSLATTNVVSNSAAFWFIASLRGHTKIWINSNSTIKQIRAKCTFPYIAFLGNQLTPVAPAIDKPAYASSARKYLTSSVARSCEHSFFLRLILKGLPKLVALLALLPMIHTHDRHFERQAWGRNFH